MNTFRVYQKGRDGRFYQYEYSEPNYGYQREPTFRITVSDIFSLINFGLILLGVVMMFNGGERQDPPEPPEPQGSQELQEEISDRISEESVYSDFGASP